MWHGGGQFSKTYESTPDGREGFQDIFVRRNYPVYNIDEPATARAGRTTAGATVSGQGFLPSFEQDIWPGGSEFIGRLGNGATWFPNVKFPMDYDSLVQFQRQSADLGQCCNPTIDALASDAGAALFDRIGPAILVDHSAAGNPVWQTAIKSSNVKAIIAYEVVALTFPVGETPPLDPTYLPSPEIPLDDFLKLTKIPIRLIFGDNIDLVPGTLASMNNAYKFAEVINRYGGDAKVIHLPTDAGIIGNTHFFFSDHNVVEVADHMEQVLKELGLDKRPGPRRKHRASLTIDKQGTFFVGPVTPDDTGTQFFYGDDAYVQYQIPAKSKRPYPLVLWHGENQSGKQWESTPDGRDGFQSLLLREGYSTYIMDQPRRGRGGRGMEGTTVPSATESLAQGGEAAVFESARLGDWNPPSAPSFFRGVQFPRDSDSLEQFFRQQTPDIGVGDWEGADPTATTNAVSDLLDTIGPSVLVTHSASGGPGWLTAIKDRNVKGIVSYEPLRFMFPAGELPPQVGDVPMVEVSYAEFKKLTRIPIQVVYGDNLHKDPASSAAFSNAKEFVKAIKRHGGDAELLHLPSEGLRGNTHFPFSDLNNEKVAKLLFKYLDKKGLDRGRHGHGHGHGHSHGHGHGHGHKGRGHYHHASR
jgi:hypothetical protein